MEIILTENAPAPRGHYSQAVVHAGLVYVSGTLPLDPATGQPAGGEVEAQAERALENLKAVLEAAGSGLDCVLKTTVYVSDISLWSRVNAVYARYFGDHRPARTMAPVSALHYGCLVEIDAIAVNGCDTNPKPA
jgi:2-iminobutanoate/2-iminopropanoate deaminase